MDHLFYFSKSANKPAGRGANEYVQQPHAYTELNTFPHWRKVLSNFYVHPFEWRGRKWNSVEHVFQSQKIAIVSPEKAEWFTLDSGHDIGRGDGEMARKHRKLVILNAQQLHQWNKIKSTILEEALYAKFSQVPLAQQVLVATGDAALLHGTRGIPVQRQMELEHVRRRVKLTTTE
jgi:ribA/ribD-fused uncharacterized protein